jgi:hypothetical protein
VFVTIDAIRQIRSDNRISVPSFGPHGHDLEVTAGRRTKQEQFCTLKIVSRREIYDKTFWCSSSSLLLTFG